ncbi:MAG: hypothetical protein KAJ14_04990 [Candidatus Omnitrophica bacterium]|nr:hypothetical protein [Candidatus Omnitrophota bacterium]
MIQNKNNWIISEAKKADKTKDLIILENPQVLKFLDERLLNDFWPVILSCFEKSGYVYSLEPNIESEWGYDLERTLMFMLLDEKRFDLPRAIFRGKLKISKTDWMLGREFFLSLPSFNDPRAVFEILGNSRFKGNPPTLIVDKEKEDDFYQIDFSAGDGASWGMYDNNDIKEKIKQIIKINLKMHEFSRDGISLKQIGEFLTIAYEAYEAF